MTLTVDATYEDGVLKLLQPLPLQEHERVRVRVETQATPLMKSYGIVGWTGDHATLEPFALDAELDPEERP